jgi:hypothetical protein
MTKVITHGEWFCCIFLVLPAMVFDYFVDVLFAAELDVVLDLLDIHPVESLDYA